MPLVLLFAANGKCFEITSHNDQNGGRSTTPTLWACLSDWLYTGGLEVYSCTGGANQKWALIDNQLVSQEDSDFVVTVCGYED